MSDDAAFTGSIPGKYDKNLGPFLFEEYASDLARRIGVPGEGRVLELACGTGISTKAIRDALPASVEIVATDLNEAMLDYARAKHGAIARFEIADACELPYGDGEFDAVANQFGIMYVSDKLASSREVLRVLRPGGHYVFNVWDSLEANPAVLLVQQQLERLADRFEQGVPQFFQTPYGYYDTGAIRSLMNEAGFTKVEIEAVEVDSVRPSAREIAEGLVQGSPMGHEVKPGRQDSVIGAIAAALADTFGDDPIRSTLRAIVIDAS
jgi:ubiquinone/menaquinone biosynthesis C-methylase UbiE